MPSQADPAGRPRRFYKAVNVEPDDGGFGMRLDGRPAKSPGGARLVAPTERLAQLLAAEWSAQGAWIEAKAMPATRLAFTALDRTPAAREALAEEVARYAGTDLLCYFAEEPAALVERELAHWGPVLDWAAKDLGLDLVRATGLLPRPQPPQTLTRAAALAAELDDFSLTGLAFGAALLGSAVLAFALQRGELTGQAVFDLSRLDQAFQEERWGVDYEAADRTAALNAEALMLQRWFEALRASNA